MASDDISARPSKIIRQELQKLDESNLQTKDLKNAFALAVYHERRRELPQLGGATFRGQVLVLSDKSGEIGKWLSKFFGLPFLLPEEVADVFKNKTFNFIKLFCSKSYFHLPVVNRGQRTNIVWLTEEIFKKRSAQMKYHIINYMRANKVYICAQMKYFLGPNEMPMCPNEMHRGLHLLL